MSHDLEKKVVVITDVAKLTDNIDNIVEEVKREITELNIDLMEVNEDNKQKLKQVRTTLNKKLTSFETDRKKIKEIVLQPVVEFESVYNIKLKSLIQDEIIKLDNKIQSIEKGQIQQLEDYGREYFARKLESMPISAANTFEDANLKINLSSNNKKIREDIDAHFDKISSALIIIQSHSHSSRLRVLWEKETHYDIGVALVKLTQQLNEEQQFESVHPQIKQDIKVETFQHKTIESVIPEELYDFTLNITVSESQLELLTDFMSQHYIEFEVKQ
jgi:hypothetical protein